MSCNQEIFVHDQEIFVHDQDFFVHNQDSSVSAADSVVDTRYNGSTEKDRDFLDRFVIPAKGRQPSEPRL